MLDNLKGIEGSNVKLCLWGRHMGRFGDSSPQEGPQTGAGAREMKGYDLTTTLHSHLPVLLGRRWKGWQWGWARQEGWFSFYFSLLICSKLSYFFPKLSLFFPWQLLMSSLCPKSSVHPKAFSLCFLSMSREGRMREQLGGQLMPSQVNPAHLADRICIGKSRNSASQGPQHTWHSCRPSARNSSVSNGSCWWHCH